MCTLAKGWKGLDVLGQNGENPIPAPCRSAPCRKKYIVQHKGTNVEVLKCWEVKRYKNNANTGESQKIQNQKKCELQAFSNRNRANHKLLD